MTAVQLNTRSALFGLLRATEFSSEEGSGCSTEQATPESVLSLRLRTSGNGGSCSAASCAPERTRDNCGTDTRGFGRTYACRSHCRRAEPASYGASDNADSVGN
ncbi:hypothetical protein GCM10010368_59890 [Streptomyces roseiscleroticus]|uniref:Uncharacterized protein n=1 Tax=Streptomyces roseiscleroticus TaxID=1972 RepID=A0ABN3F3K1_9ACTN